MIKSLGFILTLFIILTTSCGQKSLTLSELKNHDIKFETQNYQSSKINYKMLIPSSWSLMSTDEVDGHYIESFSDTIFNQPSKAKDRTLCIMTIETFKGSSSLDSTFNSILAANKDHSPMKIVESGKSDYLKYDSYFFHFKSDTKTPGEIEGFTFIVKGMDDLTYYGLNISAPQYDINELKDNLAKMLYCIQTFQFEIEPKEVDSIIFDSVKINEKIPLKLPVKSLIKNLGRPDSIKTGEGWECGNYLNELDSVTVYYYGKSRFIISKGEALLHVLYLSDNKLSFGTKDFKISSQITESELKALFPKSYDRMIYKIKTDKNYGERRLLVDMIEQPLYQDGCGFVFYLENGKLSRIELWWFIC